MFLCCGLLTFYQRHLPHGAFRLRAANAPIDTIAVKTLSYPRRDRNDDRVSTSTHEYSRTGLFSSFSKALKMKSLVHGIERAARVENNEIFIIGMIFLIPVSSPWFNTSS
jgi:hypothetical protein